jgi:glycosyltransferase involved in cell wall biosynthesis
LTPLGDAVETPVVPEVDRSQLRPGPRIGLVVQRYGAEVNGGAEAHCRMLAERLVRSSRVSGLRVFTSCALDHVTWRNHYPPGLSLVGGVEVERFPVPVPHIPVADGLLSFLAAGPLRGRSRALDRLWLLAQGPVVSGLPPRLAEVRSAYDAFVFFTYRYYPTVHGLPLVRNRAILIPTAHDEPALRLGIFDELLRLPRAFAFNTPEEAALVEARLGEAPRRAEVVGCGVDLAAPPPAPDPETACGPFLLYLGRIEAGKGFPDLFEHLEAFRARHRETRFISRTGRPYLGRDLRLLLAGRASVRVPGGADASVVHLGFVDEARKAALLRDAELLVSPSRLESLSIVLLEAWTMGTPVLVNGACEVLAGQTRRSGGGLAYLGERGFVEALERLLSDGARVRGLAEAGRRFASERYGWGAILERMLGLVEEVRAAPRP